MKQELQHILQKIIYEKWGIAIVPKVEISQNFDHGDYTTNVAMMLAGKLKTNPITIAKEIVDSIKCHVSSIKANEHHRSTDQKDQNISDKKMDFSVLQDIDKIEVIPPGFINLFLSASNLSNTLTEVLKEKEGVGTVSSIKYQVSSIMKNSNMIHDTLTHDTTAKRIMVEFAHPNTHKAFHIGHLRNITTGECIVRLLESQGTKVIRANYQGDVGMHIAKCLYGILHNEEIKKQIDIYSSNEVRSSHPAKQDSNYNEKQKVELLGKAYAAGSKAYEDPSTSSGQGAKKEIGEINKKIYAIISGHPERSEGSSIKEDSSVSPQNDLKTLYQTTRQWSLDYFETIYQRVGSHYDKYYFESQTFEIGKEVVKKNIPHVFEESEGAIIFPGEKYGLHNRVFITGEGNATYEGKDMGLITLQLQENPDKIIHVVGPEQAEYFKVVFKAQELCFPKTKGLQYHLIYGWVKLKHGKMSSRSGNVILGEWLLDETKKEIYNILEKNASKNNNKTSDNKTIRQEDKNVIARSEMTKQSLQYDNIAEKVAIAAVKYSFLKVSTRQEISFDIEESVNFEGDSGPYLMYTYARCKSVLRKAEKSGIKYQVSGIMQKNMTHDTLTHDTGYNPEELSVMRLIHQFPEIVNDAATNYMPNILCKYLYDLAGSFNLFYNKHSILGKSDVSSIKYQVSSETKRNMTHDTLTHDTIGFRLSLTTAVSKILQQGLYLLGIETLERM